MKNSISGKAIFQNEGELRPFLDKQKLSEFITTRFALKEVLKE
jgi:hypothetical protein